MYAVSNAHTTTTSEDETISFSFSHRIRGNTELLPFSGGSKYFKKVPRILYYCTLRK